MVLRVYEVISNLGTLLIIQSDEDCCNTCEEVREAYRRKGWAITNPDVIDQVYFSWFLVSDFVCSISILLIILIAQPVFLIKNYTTFLPLFTYMYIHELKDA